MWWLHYIIFPLKWSIYSLWVEMFPSLTKTTMQKGPGLDGSTYCMLSLVQVFHTVVEMPVIFLAIETYCHLLLEQGNFLVPYRLDISLAPSCKRGRWHQGRDNPLPWIYLWTVSFTSLSNLLNCGLKSYSSVLFTCHRQNGLSKTLLVIFLHKVHSKP